MAERDYFSHVDPDGNGINILMHRAGYTLPEDWIKPRSSNFFESIFATGGVVQPETVINELIRDRGVNPPGHRQHLLSARSFDEGATEGAIAIVRCQSSGCSMMTYVVVVIAKRDW
jgi:hypothetical protein